MPDLVEILAKASDTKALEYGFDSLQALPNLFAELFPGKRPVIVADTNTHNVAGRRITSLIDKLNPHDPIIFNEQHFHAEWKYIDFLVEQLSRRSDSIAIAVGSGTINDLTKLSSHILEKRYISVGTAASMDGYTAFGASIVKDGAKQTFSCPAPLAFVADINVLISAPATMNACGYADLYAKVPAGADWILSDFLGVEPLDELSFHTVQDCLPLALGCPSEVKAGKPLAIGKLTEGLLYGGFAMQMHRSSRPASGADHQFSHLWNMEHHTLADGTTPSHGFQVAIGTMMSMALYEEMLKEDFSKIDVEKCVVAWPTLDELTNTATQMFASTDFPEIGVKEQSAKYIDHNGLRDQLKLLQANGAKLQDIIRSQINPFINVYQNFFNVGAPVHPLDINITPQRLRQSVVRAQYIRHRFTILDLGIRTRLLNKWIDGAMKRICNNRRK